MPAPSIADTLYAYVVRGAMTHLSAVQVWAASTCFKKTPFRWILYAVRPEPPVSVAAVHARLIRLQPTAEAVRPPGTEGAIVSCANADAIDRLKTKSIERRNSPHVRLEAMTNLLEPHKEFAQCQKGPPNAAHWEAAQVQKLRQQAR